jgi:phosphatidylinositol glycan class V
MLFGTFTHFCAMRRHVWVLLVLSLITRLLSLVLVFASSYLPLFDSSPSLILSTQSWTSALARWDAFHFLHVANEGYVYEQEWAFFPGTPFVMRHAGQIIRLMDPSGSLDPLLIGGASAALICDSTLTLYRLSLHHLGSPSLAFLATVLSLLPGSPATLRLIPYSEPFFTCLSYHGEYISFE